MHKDNKKGQEASEVDAQIQRSTRHKIIIIIVAVLMFLAGVSLYAHHSVVEQHQDNVRKSRQLSKSIRIERKHDHSESSEGASGLSMKKQKYISEYAQGLTMGFKKRHIDTSVSFDASSDQVVYHLTHQVAKAWSAYSVAKQVGPQKMKVSKTKYQKLLAQFKKSHAGVQKFLSVTQHRLEKRAHSSSLSYRVVTSNFN